MKKFIRIMSIILLVLGLLAIMIGFFFRYSYFHTMDGSFDLYERIKRYMIIFFTSGGVSTILGVVGLIFGRKIK